KFKLSKEDAELAKEEEDKKDGGDEKKEEGDKKKDKDKDKKKKEEEKKVEPLKFDLQGLEDRKVRLTVNSSDLSSAVLSNDGEKIYYMAAFEKGYDLWQTELRTHETKIINKMGADGAGALQLD